MARKRHFFHFFDFPFDLGGFLGILGDFMDDFQGEMTFVIINKFSIIFSENKI